MSRLLCRPFSLLPVSLILAGAVALPGMVQASPEISADNTEASASPEVPADNSEVSVSPEISTKVVLLLGRREISVIRDGEKLGPWPVAIGDPRTPTPTGVFKVENKVTNSQYQSTNLGE
ncbi:L,D-transpeptidase [Prochlorococcus marinus]|uniref:L,D-transpeptidase n=1 Tax=Prochlorococcus TaxID=1218 RepID=UPI0022873585|nr:L,D-transpeptidase [Prochlorococcus marinus]